MKPTSWSDDDRPLRDPLITPYTLLADAWMSAWMQPLATWQRFVGEQWQRWLEAMAHLPSPWMPALAQGRERQTPAIDFFLPWLPMCETSEAGEQADAPAPDKSKEKPAASRAPRKPAGPKRTAAAAKATAASATVSAPQTEN